MFYHNINTVTHDGYTLLTSAVMAKDSEEVKKLLQQGADPKILMEDDRTALHYAVNYSAPIEIIQMLIDAGADRNAITSTKSRPLDMIAPTVPAEYLDKLLSLGFESYKKSELIKKFMIDSEQIQTIEVLLTHGYFSKDADNTEYFANAVTGNQSEQFLTDLMRYGFNPAGKNHKGEPYFSGSVRCLSMLLDRKDFYEKRIDWLLSHGADINMPDSHGTTALLYACRWAGNSEIINYLLSRHADRSLRDNDNKSALAYLAENGRFKAEEKELISEQLNSNKQYPQTEQQQDKNITPQIDHESFIMDFSAKQQEYFSRGYVTKKEYFTTEPGLNEIDPEDDYTPLARAVVENDAQKVKSLLEQGADPAIRMQGGETALHYALGNGVAIEIIKMIIEHGGDINMLDECSCPPLDQIDANQNVAYLQSVFDLGAVSKRGNALMFHFARQGTNIECVKYLLTKGYSLTACDTDGVVPLAAAIYSNDSDQFVADFIDLGADPNAKNIKTGEPCFWGRMLIGIYQNKSEILKTVSRMVTVFSHGADINLTDSYGRTAFMNACGQSKPALAEALIPFHPDLSLKDNHGLTAVDYIDQNYRFSARAKKNLHALLSSN
jgi:ankyrin repeat protein